MSTQLENRSRHRFLFNTILSTDFFGYFHGNADSDILKPPVFNTRKWLTSGEGKQRKKKKLKIRKRMKRICWAALTIMRGAKAFRRDTLLVEWRVIKCAQIDSGKTCASLAFSMVSLFDQQRRASEMIEGGGGGEIFVMWIVGWDTVRNFRWYLWRYRNRMAVELHFRT